MHTTATTPEPTAPATAVDLEIVDKNPQVVTLVKQSGLEPLTAKGLVDAYRPFFGEVNRLLEEAKRVEVKDATEVTMIRHARELRLKLREQRIAADKIREQLKADSLRRSNAVQGLFNVLKFMVEPVEEKLLAAEQFAERAEADRKAAAKKKREEELRPFGVDPQFYRLDEMSEENYQKLLGGTRAAYEKQEADKKRAEEERIAKEKAEADERERIRLENERLKKEAEEVAAFAKLERERLAEEKRKADEAAKAQREEFARKEREAIERTEREIAEIKRKNEEVARAEREKRDAEEREAQKKRQADNEERDRKHKEQLAALKKKADEEAAARKKFELEAAANAQRDAKLKQEQEANQRALAALPDKQKLATFAADVRALTVPALTSPAGLLLMTTIEAQREKFAAWAVKQAESL